MIFAVAYSLINTYAIFYSEGTGKIRQENATWRIYVNEKILRLTINLPLIHLS